MSIIASYTTLDERMQSAAEEIARARRSAEFLRDDAARTDLFSRESREAIVSAIGDCGRDLSKCEVFLCDIAEAPVEDALYSAPNRAYLFRGMAIEDAGERYTFEHGVHPVIYLSLGEVEGASWEDALELIEERWPKSSTGTTT